MELVTNRLGCEVDGSWGEIIVAEDISVGRNSGDIDLFLCEVKVDRRVGMARPRQD